MILHLAMFFLKLQAGYSMELMILIISCGRSLYLLAPLRKSRKRLVKVTLIFLEQKRGCRVHRQGTLMAP